MGHGEGFRVGTFYLGSFQDCTPLGLLGRDMGHGEGFRVGTFYLGSFQDCTPLGLLGWDMGQIWDPFKTAHL